MKYWIITDTHFFHVKMIEYCGRPEGFEYKIQKGLEVVGSEDILIHLGDICIGKDALAHLQFIQPLQCKKWLIRGNHDKKSDKWYLEHGWDFVGNEILLDKFGKRILLTHRPAPDGEYDINVHGHQHNNQDNDLVHDAEYGANKHDKQKLFAIEFTNYQPVLLQKFIGE